MKIFLDMEQCHRFLHSWQDTEPVAPLHRRWNLWTPDHWHASKQLEIISWFHTNDISVHSSDPKFTHYQMSILFSKEHVIFRSHPDNLVCRWDPLDSPKKDPDCPGHPTHFQPCTYPHLNLHFKSMMLWLRKLQILTMLPAICKYQPC